LAREKNKHYGLEDEISNLINEYALQGVFHGAVKNVSSPVPGRSVTTFIKPVSSVSPVEVSPLSAKMMTGRKKSMFVDRMIVSEAIGDGVVHHASIEPRSLCHPPHIMNTLSIHKAV